MAIQGLGYVGMDATDFEPWRAFATDVLAMQVVDRAQDAIAFRMDDRCQRVIVQRSDRDAPAFFGFQSPDPASLKETLGRIETAGVKLTRATEKELMLRGVEDMAWCLDPAGNRIEFFHGLAAGDGPFVAPRPHGGFRSGPLGMGHAVFHVTDIDTMSAFYRETLGFRLTDYMVHPYRLMFLRANPRHHSVALLQSKFNGVHHVLFEVLALDDVGRAYDFALEKWKVGQTLGRHSNDYTLSFYTFCPAGFMMEYGWGSRTVDDATWKPREVSHGGSMWGHDRLWMDDERRRKANDVRRETIMSGLGAPLQITRGQYDEVE